MPTYPQTVLDHIARLEGQIRELSGRRRAGQSLIRERGLTIADPDNGGIVAELGKVAGTTGFTVRYLLQAAGGLQVSGDLKYDNGEAYVGDFGTSRTVSSSGSFLGYTGAPVITITVPASGNVLVRWGFEGYNNNSPSATVRIAPVLSGANSIAATFDPSACSGAGVPANEYGTHSASEPPMASACERLFTGLNPGSTTFTMRGRISSGSTSTHIIRNSWLRIEPRP